MCVSRWEHSKMKQRCEMDKSAVSELHSGYYVGSTHLLWGKPAAAQCLRRPACKRQKEEHWFSGQECGGSWEEGNDVWNVPQDFLPATRTHTRTLLLYTCERGGPRVHKVETYRSLYTRPERQGRGTWERGWLTAAACIWGSCGI